MLEKREEGSRTQINSEKNHPNSGVTRRDSPITIQKERRKRPRIPRQSEVPSRPPELADYASVISAPELEELENVAQLIAGKSIRIVSPSPRSDIAELQLQRARLLRELGLNVKDDAGGYRRDSVKLGDSNDLNWQEDVIIFYKNEK